MKVVMWLACVVAACSESGPSSVAGTRARAPQATPPDAAPDSAVTVPEADAPTCGDGTCNTGETCSTCESDCGACSTGSGGSGGAVGTQTSWPCARCITSVPAAYDPSVPTPLVISLHGDEGTPTTSHRIWKQAALESGYILVSLACPRDLGCKKRWGTGDWHPGGPAGSVAWIEAQLDAVEAAYNVDRARIYIVGGSRGAVYVGFHADALAPRIAGAAMYAGGYSSVSGKCAACALPVYILVGDRDYLLDIARKAQRWFLDCGSEVMFDKLRRVSHAGAGKALLRGKAKAILAWFSTRPNACLPRPGGRSP